MRFSPARGGGGTTPGHPCLLGLLVLGVAIAPLHVLPSRAEEKDLLAYWSFDEGSGTVAHDYSGNNFHLTVPGAVWTAGISGHALHFRGNVCPSLGDGFEDFFVLSGDYSVEVWVKHEETTSQIYVSKWTGAGASSAWWLGFFQDNVQWAEYNEQSQVRLKGPNIADGRWHHVVGVRAADSLALFVDGQLVAQGKSPGKLVGTNGAPVRIAGFGPGRTGSWLYFGVLDEIRVYSRALAADEIQQRFTLISSGKKSPTTGPIAEGLPARVLVRVAVPEIVPSGSPGSLRLSLITNRSFSGEAVAIHFRIFDHQRNLVNEWQTSVQPDAGRRTYTCSISLPELAEGHYHLVASVSGSEVTQSIEVRDFRPIIAENLKIKEQRARESPFYRGIVSAYAGLRYKPDGDPDVDETLAYLKELGVNVYTYLICPRSQAELAALGEFCEKAAASGIEVWVYLVPPSEAPIDGDKPIPQRRYPPFDMDYLKWAEAVANISLKHPNLTLWMIDDFGGNLGFFTREYTRDIYQTSKRINPRLLFGVCVYHESLERFAKAGYLEFVDALLWGYQHSSSRYPECGLDATTLPLEIHDYLATGKIAIPCIYFTPHSSWPEGRPTKAYLEQAMTTAFEQSGIVWVFTTPPPGSFQETVVKEFTRQHSLEKWKSP